MTERIAAAAVKVSDRLFTGPSHMTCAVTLMSLEDLTTDEKRAMFLAREQGFVTDAGRFVSREEAFKIAKAQSQIIDQPCVNHPEGNEEPCACDEPKLDSDMIREYAPMTPAGRALLGWAAESEQGGAPVSLKTADS